MRMAHMHMDIIIFMTANAVIFMALLLPTEINYSCILPRER